jgi:hypothetical protein
MKRNKTKFCSLQNKIFETLHSPAHPGRRATCSLISSRNVWRGLAKDVMAWVSECLKCQKGKVHRHVRLRPHHVAVLAQRF